MTLEKEILQVKPFRNEYHKAGINLIYTGKWMLQLAADMVKEYNLTPQQYNILRILKGKYSEPLGVLQIRKRMLDRMSDASRIIEVLRKKGLVERNICEDNRRQMHVIITAEGMRLIDEIENENDRMDSNLTALNEEEITQLNLLLDKVRDRITIQKSPKVPQIALIPVNNERLAVA